MKRDDTLFSAPTVFSASTVFSARTSSLPSALAAGILAGALLAPALGAETLKPDPSPAAGEPGTAEILATVEGRPIHADQLRDQLRRPSNTAPRVDRERADAVLTDLIQEETAYAAARKAGFHERPEIVAAIRRLIVDRFLEDRLAPQLDAITVTDEDVETHYAAHRERFVVPSSHRAAVVRVSVPTTASKETRESLRSRAESARSEALTTESSTFGAVAVRYSDHQESRYRGGEVGSLGPESWPSPLLRALEKQETGTVSPVIETDHAFYLVKAIDKQPERPQTLEEARRQIVHELFQAKRQAVKDELYEGFAAGLKLERFPERLDLLLSQEEALARRTVTNPQ